MVRSVTLLTTVVAALLGTAACTKKEPQPGEATKPAEQKAEAPAAAAKEIVIGQTMPYSGPASAYGTIGKVQAAYFEMLNRNGGINGRKIKFVSLDDSYSPPKTVEQVRRLVEQEHVQAIFSPVGTAANSAVHGYLNQKKVPHLFVSSGATKWNDPEHFPFTIGFNPSYQREGRTYAAHILKNNPKAKIAVLYQNDDLGKDLLTGLKAGLGDKTKQIIAEVSYEMSDPTVDSQLVTLKASGADTLVFFTTPKAGAQAIRKVYDMGWKPARYVTNVSASIGAVLTPAGLDRAKGMFTAAYTKDPLEKQWENDADVKEFLGFMKAEFPSGDLKDGANVVGYITAKTLSQVLTNCGDDLSPTNIMAKAAALKDFNPGLLQPGVLINTSPTDFELFDTLRIAQFNGDKWTAETGDTAVSTR